MIAKTLPLLPTLLRVGEKYEHIAKGSITGRGVLWMSALIAATDQRVLLTAREGSKTFSTDLSYDTITAVEIGHKGASGIGIKLHAASAIATIGSVTPAGLGEERPVRPSADRGAPNACPAWTL